MDENKIKKLLTMDIIYFVLGTLVSSDTNDSIEEIDKHLEEIRRYKKVIDNDDYRLSLENGEELKETIYNIENILMKDREKMINCSM